MSQIHAKTDKLALSPSPKADGKMRVTSSSSDELPVIVPGRSWNPLAGQRCPPNSERQGVGSAPLRSTP